jgi:hypothetical protein
MFVCCECCVLSGRGLGDGLITRPEESYRLWRVVVCDQETSKTRRLKKPGTGLWKIQPQWVVNKQTILDETTGNEAFSDAVSFTPCHIVPLRPEYFPQHPILSHPQTTILVHTDRPNFTTTYKTDKI